MMTSITMRILKDNEIVYADLDVNTKGDGVKDESNEEEEDSEKSVVRGERPYIITGRLLGSNCLQGSDQDCNWSILLVRL